MIKFLVCGILVGLAAVQIATAAETGMPCPGYPEALGTSRVLAIDPATTPRVGRKHFPTTLPLADKEVVLAGMRRPIPNSRAESWAKAIRLHTIASATRCSAI